MFCPTEIMRPRRRANSPETDVEFHSGKSFRPEFSAVHFQVVILGAHGLHRVGPQVRQQRRDQAAQAEGAQQHGLATSALSPSLEEAAAAARADLGLTRLPFDRRRPSLGSGLFRIGPGVGGCRPRGRRRRGACQRHREAFNKRLSS